MQFLHVSVLPAAARGGGGVIFINLPLVALKRLSPASESPAVLLFHLPDGHFPVVLPGPAQDVAVLGGAERRHLVAVAVQLLQDLVALRVQDVHLPFG